MDVDTKGYFGSFRQISAANCTQAEEKQLYLFMYAGGNQNLVPWGLAPI